MLIRNTSGWGQPLRFFGAAAQVGLRDVWTTAGQMASASTGELSAHASIPVGYTTSAWRLAQSTGGLGSTNRTFAVATSSVTIAAWASGEAAVTASASTTSSATALKNAAGTTSGIASFSVDVIGRATIGAVLRIGSTPSADDNAFTLLDSFEVRSGVTVRQALRRAMEGAENAFAVGA
jgi:hypothetical protein